MIRLTRINGSEFSLNPDLIHRAEETPDTVLTLIDGSRYVVVQSLDELIDRIVGYRARVVAAAGSLATAEVTSTTPVDDADDDLDQAVDRADRARQERQERQERQDRRDDDATHDGLAVAGVVPLRARRA
ncbi:flagellar FlbD family protein [Jannaschia sp. R86511]|uniref:flagellar FlbD family protein n=1 Tax=Jannaschia sp. R86511 TaxID=3093853 RepID=UPI0036D217DE